MSKPDSDSVEVLVIVPATVMSLPGVITSGLIWSTSTVSPSAADWLISAAEPVGVPRR